MKKSTNPKCRWCGKTLPKQWRSIGWQKLLKREPIEKRTVKAGTQYERVEYFFGTYGRYDDNNFCSLNCGHSWAVREIKRHQAVINQTEGE